MSNSLSMPWSIVCQARLSMGFPGQKYWNELPFLSPGDLSYPGIEPMSSVSCIERGFFTSWAIGEGNGNPLQCSCLENPRDGGGWWAAIYGVAQSQTRLKRLSSSSSNELILTPPFSLAEAQSLLASWGAIEVLLWPLIFLFCPMPFISCIYSAPLAEGRAHLKTI